MTNGQLIQKQEKKKTIKIIQKDNKQQYRTKTQKTRTIQ